MIGSIRYIIKVHGPQAIDYTSWFLQQQVELLTYYLKEQIYTTFWKWGNL